MTRDLSPAQRTLTVGALGAGTVGSQVTHLLTEQTDDFAARSGARLEITGVAVCDVSTPRDFVVPQDLLTDDTTAVVTDDDLVIELVGGIGPAHTLILTAFEAEVSVIIGNEALIAAHDPEFYIVTAVAGTDFYYEATVAGAIPVVYALYESMAGDHVTGMLGIVNGTTSYILGEMNTKGLSFETALATAQELGYAEADPTVDVDGLDATVKTAVIASLAFHTRVDLDGVSVEGIREVTADDIRETHASGCELKLLVIAQRRGGGYTQGVSVYVHPALVPNDHPLASVYDAYSTALIEIENAGYLMFYGQGAGEASIASVVLSDVITVAAYRIHDDQAPRESSYASLWVLGPEAVITRYQIQLRSDDAVNSLAAMASVFVESGVSINSIRQSAYVTFDGSHDQAVVTFATHPAPVFHLDVAVEGLQDSDRAAKAVSIQRVEGE